MSHTAIQLTTEDQQKLAATVFQPAAPPQAIVVIASALGVPQKIYSRFASYLAEQGMLALSFDYRGIGDSSIPPQQGAQVRFADWGEQDIEAALSWAKNQHPNIPLFLVGNSCGGQLFGLAASSTALSGAVFVAAQTAYWGHWPLPGRLQMAIMFNAVIPLLSMGKTFPARRLGMSTSNAPAGVTRQWARWGRLPRYLFDPRSGVDAKRYQTLDLPILAYGFDDDNFAPPAAIDALCRELPNANIERRQINPVDIDDKPIGHFGFFKERHREGLWRSTYDWLVAQC